MKCIIIEPGKEPRLGEVANTLIALQQAVGGHIEAVHLPASNLVLICNEEGRIQGMPANGYMRAQPLWGQLLMGTVILVRRDGEVFAPINTPTDLQYVQASWLQAREVRP